MKSIVKLKNGSTDVLWFGDEPKDTFASRIGRALVDYIPNQGGFIREEVTIVFTNEEKKEK